MSFLKSKGFKYLKNLIIGVGAALVLLGALFKIESWEGATLMLTIGMLTEAFIFLFLGLIGPEPDYYWNKLYPGLDNYDSKMTPIAATAGDQLPGLNGQIVENKLGGMLTELQGMSKSLSSLKALQEVDFSSTKDQIKTMGNFYTKMNEAMSNMSDSIDDSKRYKEQLVALNKNLGSLNSVYGGMLSAMSNIGK
ncbi:MAG: gliding motility protein GldL [Saprospiraceae bacterium]|nr:gliding motility protein GldL [Saprospiraceae bacterium]MBP7699174.1 gliding motility protein GldL [Saprospiraceae bacterium]